jgi:hypothetical protein
MKESTHSVVASESSGNVIIGMVGKSKTVDSRAAGDGGTAN